MKQITTRSKQRVECRDDQIAAEEAIGIKGNGGLKSSSLSERRCGEVSAHRHVSTYGAIRSVTVHPSLVHQVTPQPQKGVFRQRLGEEVRNILRGEDM